MSTNSESHDEMQTQFRHCPLLGTARDPMTRATFPIQEHRCYSIEGPQKINLQHQLDFCLTDHYPACTRYESSMKRLAALSPAPSTAESAASALAVDSQAVRRNPEDEGTGPQENQLKRSRLPLVLLVLVTLALFSIALVLINQARMGSTPASAIQAAKTTTVTFSPIAAGTGSTAVALKSNPTLAATAVTTTRSTPASSIVSESTPAGLVLLSEVAEQEKNLRTGHLEATIQYGGGNQASNQVEFDMGDANHPPRLHIITTYQNSQEKQTLERLVIGGQAWQRQGNGPWIKTTDMEGAWEQVQTFLPHADAVSQANTNSGGTTINELRWYDPSRNMDVTCKVDPSTAIPEEMTQVMRSTNSVLTVVYGGWNTPVNINPPQ